MSRRKISEAGLYDLLESKVVQYNRPDFIAEDPISIPRAFRKKHDIEIAGFFAAVLAWGQRGTIIRKCRELMAMMDNDPHDFIINHSDADLKPFLQFKHRTFNATDTLYFIAFLKSFYSQNQSLEKAFKITPGASSIETALVHFQQVFFSLPDAPERTRKHIPSPERKSTCKRLAMYLRWMVRQDKAGVDFGLWKGITPAQLVCPCDLHVDRIGRQLGLIRRKQTDWLTALELTDNLKKFDPVDPVKYDFALFSMGVSEKLRP